MPLDEDQAEQFLQEIEASVREVVKTHKKDHWDRASIIASLLTGVATLILAYIGFAFSSAYQERQHEVREIEAISQLLPHLSSQEARNSRAAFLLINSLASTELATELAIIYPGPGASGALTTIAASTLNSSQQRDLAAGTLFDLSGPWIVKIKSKIGNELREKSGFFFTSSGYILTASFSVTEAPGESEIAASEVKAQLADGRELPASVVFVDALRDIAILKVDITETPFVRLVDRAAHVGDQLIVVGYSRDDRPTRITGDVIIVKGHFAYYSRERASVPGFGGAAVLDSQGEVIGVNWGATRGEEPDLPKFVRSDSICDLLREIVWQFGSNDDDSLAASNKCSPGDSANEPGRSSL